MDSSLWALLLHSPELPVPYPWERCFDISTEILFYKNQLDGTIVLDLRPRLQLGESLVYVNSLWNELTGHYPMNYRPDLSSVANQPDQGPPIILYSNCCGRLIYLFVPELVQNCPLCGCFIYYLGS